MIEAFYMLIIALCLLFISIGGFITAVYLWKKSVEEFKIDA